MPRNYVKKHPKGVNERGKNVGGAPGQGPWTSKTGERAWVLMVLELCNNNLTRTSQLTGFDRRTIRKWYEELTEHPDPEVIDAMKYHTAPVDEMLRRYLQMLVNIGLRKAVHKDASFREIQTGIGVVMDKLTMLERVKLMAVQGHYLPAGTMPANEDANAMPISSAVRRKYAPAPLKEKASADEPPQPPVEDEHIPAPEEIAAEMDEEAKWRALVDDTLAAAARNGETLSHDEAIEAICVRRPEAARYLKPQNEPVDLAGDDTEQAYEN